VEARDRCRDGHDSDATEGPARCPRPNQATFRDQSARSYRVPSRLSSARSRPSQPAKSTGPAYASSSGS
jgi:hypothetical protein